jgi:hypothetical protein
MHQLPANNRHPVSDCGPPEIASQAVAQALSALAQARAAIGLARDMVPRAGMR